MPALSVTCDPNWARQVIVGLVRNALSHAREGGALRLAAEVEAHCAGLSLTDNGPGIPPEAQARVFERFEQAGARAQGFGIGLALAKWVVEAQGGQIALISPVPREVALGDAPGTKISVRLPRGSG